MNENSIIKNHDLILDKFLEYRKELPDFTFSLRQRDSVQSDEGRLQKGYWFTGTENYLFVGLIKRGDSSNKTKQIGFVLDYPEDLNNEVFLEVVWPGETDSKFISFYEKLVNKIDNITEVRPKKYKKFYKKSFFEAFDEFIHGDYKIIKEIIKQQNLENELLITEEDFIVSLKKIESIRDNKFGSGVFNKKINQTDSLNTILYGPPGTGKTYYSINKAISIIDDIGSEKELAAKYESREVLKSRFDELLISDWDNPKGQIGIITFHQSMSYEDFIEGIKPNTDGSENRIYYNISPGIFKKISYIASKNYVNSFKPSDVLEKEKTAEQVMADFADSVAEEIAFNGKYRLNDKVFIMEVEVDAFRYSGENWERHAAGIRMKFSDIVEFYKNDIKERIQIKDLENISQLAKQHATYYKIMYDRMKEFEKISKPVLNNSVSESLKSYVLIIDEINRGNVSQIFGELITLIEDDKRAGRPEALDVTLPYSKEKFTVPPNLYIIGTMNTADRSVEALDTALRRRFSFEFMPPRYDLPELDREVAGIKLSSLLETINERIKYLLDEDHQIGHSYFMNIEDEDDLCHVFRNKIIPLLKEYFYNDYGKIRLILGDEFVKLLPENAKPRFAVSDIDWPDREQYRIMIDDFDFNIITALKQTIANNY